VRNPGNNTCCEHNGDNGVRDQRRNKTAGRFGREIECSINNGGRYEESQVEGSIENSGAPGIRATITPAPASMAGYGSERWRATWSRNDSDEQEDKQALKEGHGLVSAPHGRGSIAQFSRRDIMRPCRL
jgi:hypothetical protein